jgi:V8-like Glu-specific endopeptidase
MSVIVTILLYVFGLDAATGQLKFKCDDNNTKKTGNLIYSSSSINNNTNTTAKHVTYSNPPTGSSDPQYP